jgi:hypothetical protein
MMTAVGDRKCIVGRNCYYKQTGVGWEDNCSSNNILLYQKNEKNEMEDEGSIHRTTERKDLALLLYFVAFPLMGYELALTLTLIAEFSRIRQNIIIIIFWRKG